MNGPKRDNPGESFMAMPKQELLMRRALDLAMDYAPLSPMNLTAAKMMSRAYGQLTTQQKARYLCWDLEPGSDFGWQPNSDYPIIALHGVQDSVCPRKSAALLPEGLLRRMGKAFTTSESWVHQHSAFTFILSLIFFGALIAAVVKSQKRRNGYF